MDSDNSFVSKPLLWGGCIVGLLAVALIVGAAWDPRDAMSGFSTTAVVGFAKPGSPRVSAAPVLGVPPAGVSVHAPESAPVASAPSEAVANPAVGSGTAKGNATTSSNRENLLKIAGAVISGKLVDPNATARTFTATRTVFPTLAEGDLVDSGIADKAHATYIVRVAHGTFAIMSPSGDWFSPTRGIVNGAAIPAPR